MNIVWECGDCSVRDVLEKISPKRQFAYTTVATILQRLYEKGLLKREIQASVVYYSPKVSKEMYGKTMARSFVQKFFSAFGDAAITSFAESIDQLPKKKKDYFMKLLEQQNETQ